MMAPDPEVDAIIGAVQILGPIAEGSIITISSDVGEARAQLMQALRDLAGHDQFVVVELGDTGAMQVLGPDAAKAMIGEIVAELLDERGES